MKKYFLFLIIPFTVIADTCTLYQEGGGDWRIVCDGSGLVYNYVDITNNVYIIENCEEFKNSLLSSIDSIKSDFSVVFNSSRFLNSEITYGLIPTLNNSSFQNPSDRQTALDFAESLSTRAETISFSISNIEDTLFDSPNSIERQIQSINCASCPTNGASGGGSGDGSCCDVDFTEIIDRLIAAEQQRAAISNQIARISHYLGVVTNQLAYNNFLLEHGFGSVTNLLFSTDQIDDYLLDYGDYYRLDPFGHIDFLYSYYLAGFTPAADLLRIINYNLAEELPSLNNYNYNFQYRIFPQFTNQFATYRRDFSAYSDETTNFFSFFRGEIGVRGVLEDWTSEQVDGSYYDFLTNHYINVVRGGSLSGYQAEKTNWFARIETLLASLVFLDSSNTNSYNEAAGSVSNSLSRVKDEFNNRLDGVSSASSTQIELVSDIEQSMYESLQSFSKAFSSASLPSTVQLLYVHKTSGAKSLPSSDTVDVTVPVEGNLMDFIEIIRSCTTLCWVFFGLWFMFKFSVWTVKKIYMLIRYIIDFFNMVAGGK